MFVSQPANRLEGLLRKEWGFISILLVLVGLVALTFIPALALFQDGVILLLIRIVIVVGIYVFMGNTGIASLSHVGFMAIAAYASAWLTCSPALKKLMMHGLPEFILNANVPPLTAAIYAGLLAAGVGLLVGYVILRLQGIACSIAGFSLLFIIYVTYGNWNSVTLGQRAIVGIPAYVTNSVAFGFTLFAVSVAYAYQKSRWGLLARAVRDDEHAALAAGINVIRHRVIAFTLGAFLSGLGGVLYVHHIGTVQIDMFFLHQTFLLLSMLVVGGQSLAGAVVGVTFVTLVFDILKYLERPSLGAESGFLPVGFAEIGLGILVLAVLVYLPKGITGGREFSLNQKQLSISA